MKLSIRILLCIIVSGFFLYFFITRQNALTILRLEIPVVDKELRVILEQNKSLKYEIDQFENPAHLMRLAQEPEFAHLKYPYTKDIIVLPLIPPLPCQNANASLPCRAP